MADINRMMRGSVAIYCEAPKAVADDISYMLRTGAEEIETLRARVARLEEALREIRDYDSYKHPDESVIALREAAIKESDDCTACQYAKQAKWPPSGLCNKHYSLVTNAHDRVAQMFSYKQTWEPREIARRALEEK